jgi:hypothetical protein
MNPDDYRVAPRYIDARLARGQVYLQLTVSQNAAAGKPLRNAALALEEFRAVVAQDPSLAAAHDGAGRSLALLGRLYDAMEVCMTEESPLPPVSLVPLKALSSCMPPYNLARSQRR